MEDNPLDRELALGMAALSRAAAALELACRERRSPAALDTQAREVAACLAPIIAGLRAGALQPSPPTQDR